MQSLSIELTIAKDFLKQFSPTKKVSRYNPTAYKLAHLCKLTYPDGAGGVYPIQPSHIVDAAIALGFLVKSNGDNAQIGISAKQVNKRTEPKVFSETLICVHGPARYTFIANGPLSLPKIKACCPRCANGYKRPSKSDVKSAIGYITGVHTNAPGAGALILAARQLKFKTSRSFDGTLRIARRPAKK